MAENAGLDIARLDNNDGLDNWVDIDGRVFHFQSYS